MKKSIAPIKKEGQVQNALEILNNLIKNKRKGIKLVPRPPYNDETIRVSVFEIVQEGIRRNYFSLGNKKPETIVDEDEFWLYYRATPKGNSDALCEICHNGIEIEITEDVKTITFCPPHSTAKMVYDIVNA